MAMAHQAHDRPHSAQTADPTFDTARFDQDLNDLTATLGDSTRRGIYIAVRESSEPLTASQIAEMFDIHPNVARHHLDRLATDGYLDISRRRPEGRSGPGAGRPAKCYSASGKEIDVHYPSRRLDLLTDLLMAVIVRLDPANAGAVAKQVGYEYGAAVAEEIGLPSDSDFPRAVRAVAQAMTGVGFGMTADVDASQLITSHCPFGELATSHPDVVCSLDQGLIAGLMNSVDRTWEPIVFPHKGIDRSCVTEVTTG
jgi:predicted ArsR family transcriptional regulator